MFFWKHFKDAVMLVVYNKSKTESYSTFKNSKCLAAQDFTDHNLLQGTHWTVKNAGIQRHKCIRV